MTRVIFDKSCNAQACTYFVGDREIVDPDIDLEPGLYKLTVIAVGDAGDTASATGTYASGELVVTRTAKIRVNKHRAVATRGFHVRAS